MVIYSFTDPEGMEGWVGLVCWHIADTLPTKWSHVHHGSGVDQVKFASQRPTSIPLSHAAKSQYLGGTDWCSQQLRTEVSERSTMATYGACVRTGTAVKIWIRHLMIAKSSVINTMPASHATITYCLASGYLPSCRVSSPLHYQVINYMRWFLYVGWHRPIVTSA